MAVTRTAEDIPLVVLSDGYWTDRGAFLAEAYAHYGPVFRARHLKTEVVFLIGPEANRFPPRNSAPGLFTHRWLELGLWWCR